MKTFIALLISLQVAVASDTVTVIPRPLNVTPATTPAVTLTEKTALHFVGDTTQPVAAWLRTSIALATSLAIAEPSAGDGDGIVLRLDPTLSVPAADWAQDEAYQLTAGNNKIEITARTPHGLFYGCTTLVQLARRGDNGVTVPALTIKDAPRFRWRGLMLDCGRHFFTVDEVKRFIDLLAFHKFNRFHWHLTEDQGWRIEVKAKPRLTSVGAWRSESPKMGDAKKGDGQPYGGFYTHDDIRTIVAYAASRFVIVVPEIEMPGHSTAAIAAYPEIGNTDIPGWKEPTVANRWGVKGNTLAPKEETFAFIETVFDEILPLFPSEYVHIGGDEAPKREWDNSPFAQKIIADNKLKDSHGLQAWFIKRVEGLLHKRGKRLIGWDEIQEGGLSPTATMMVWRDWKWALLALEHGNTVVMAPKTHTYLDYRQPGSPDQPAFQTIGSGKWKPTLSLQQVYTFDPIPKNITTDQAMNVLGGQAQMWTEYIWSQAKLEYMAWPRACAVAECVWSSPERNWDDFSARLTTHLALFDIIKVNYCRTDGTPAQPDQDMNRTPRIPAP